MSATEIRDDEYAVFQLEQSIGVRYQGGRAVYDQIPHLRRVFDLESVEGRRGFLFPEKRPRTFAQEEFFGSTTRWLTTHLIHNTLVLKDLSALDYGTFTDLGKDVYTQALMCYVTLFQGAFHLCLSGEFSNTDFWARIETAAIDDLQFMSFHAMHYMLHPENKDVTRRDGVSASGVVYIEDIFNLTRHTKRYTESKILKTRSHALGVYKRLETVFESGQLDAELMQLRIEYEPLIKGENVKDGGSRDTNIFNTIHVAMERHHMAPILYCERPDLLNA
jgi:hypothetical protein